MVAWWLARPQGQQLGSSCNEVCEPGMGHDGACSPPDGPAAAGRLCFPGQGEQDGCPDMLLDPQPRVASAPPLLP